jgi:hypothetical protein
MNINEAKEIIIDELKDLKVKCCCGQILLFRHSYYTFYCNICNINILSTGYSGSYISLFKDKYASPCGFVLEGSRDFFNEDIYLDLDTFISIFKMSDVEKYKEKYNNLILFK